MKIVNYGLPILVFIAIVATIAIVALSFSLNSVDDIQIKEWTAPNKVDRCYVAYWPSGGRADIACVATGGPGD